MTTPRAAAARRRRRGVDVAPRRRTGRRAGCRGGRVAAAAAAGWPGCVHPGAGSEGAAWSPRPARGRADEGPARGRPRSWARLQQRVGHRGAVGVAVGRVLGQRPLDDLDQRGREPARQRRRGLLEVQERQFDRRGGAERRRAREHLVEDHARAVDVGGGGGGAPAALLGGHVARRAHDRGGCDPRPSVLPSARRATPKSPTFTRPSVESRMLAGLTSRCTMRWAWAPASARQSWVATPQASQAGSGPRRRRAARLSPCTSSET